MPKCRPLSDDGRNIRAIIIENERRQLTNVAGRIHVTSHQAYCIAVKYQYRNVAACEQAIRAQSALAASSRAEPPIGERYLLAGRHRPGIFSRRYAAKYQHHLLRARIIVNNDRVPQAVAYLFGINVSNHAYARHGGGSARRAAAAGERRPLSPGFFWPSKRRPAPMPVPDTYRINGADFKWHICAHIKLIMPWKEGNA